MKPRIIVFVEEKEEKLFIATVAYRTDKLRRSIVVGGSTHSGNLCSVSLKELCLGNILVSL